MISNTRNAIAPNIFVTRVMASSSVSRLKLGRGKLQKRRRRKIEAQFEAADPTKPISAVTVEAKGGTTIEQAINLFVSDKRSQGVSAEVPKKYERELDRLKEFMAKRCKFFPNEITMTEFRAEWNDLYPSSTTRSKVQERLTGFLRYCLASHLITRLPILSPIQVTTPRHCHSLTRSTKSY
jgi:hypothetical protein